MQKTGQCNTTDSKGALTCKAAGNGRTRYVPTHLNPLARWPRQAHPDRMNANLAIAEGQYIECLNIECDRMTNKVN